MRKVFAVVHPITVFACIFFMAMLVLIIFVHVVLRYGFRSGISWSEEVSMRILIPAFVFLGMAVGVEEKLHININVIPKNLPKWLDITLDTIKYLLNIAIGVIFVYYGLELSLIMAKSILPATELPNTLQYIAMPLTGVLFIIISIMFLFQFPQDEKWIDKFLGPDEDAEEGEE